MGYRNAAEKVAGTGNEKIILTERGTSFGYQNLVVDMRSFPDHAQTRLSGRLRRDPFGAAAGRRREFERRTARIYRAAGPRRQSPPASTEFFSKFTIIPRKALSDGTNALPLDQFRPLLRKIPASRRWRAGTRPMSSRSAATAQESRQRASPVGNTRVHGSASPPPARLRIEAEAIAGLIDRLDARFEHAVELLLCVQGPHRGYRAGQIRPDRPQNRRHVFQHRHALFFPARCRSAARRSRHADCERCLLAISSSGETEELVELLEAVKRLGIPLITLTAKPHSTLAAASDIVLDIAVKEEACSLNLAPTASTAAALAMGDALAIALLERRGFKEDDFAALHPGGRLGKKLRRVEALMHCGEDVPACCPPRKCPT